MVFLPPPRVATTTRVIARLAAASAIANRLRRFSDIVVHPTQEMRDPDGAFFRGGPAWPRFGAQILARHCWGAVPRAIDQPPLPAQPEWPYFDPQFLAAFWPHLGIDRRLAGSDLRRETRRLAGAHGPLPEQTEDAAEAGIWCGPVSLHFGHMVADFGMRIAASSRIDGELPLVFSLPPFRSPEPPPHFWQLIDHLGVERRRVMLIRAPTRFRRLHVLPQAERPFGGGPSRRHLDRMDAIAGRDKPPDRDLDHLFVSRSRLAEGRFAAEDYLDEALGAAGVAVSHPEAIDLRAQLQLYRRARTLIFSEGSALHALQLLGRLDADVVVLVRRPANRIAEASLRPRVRSLRYLAATRALVHGLTASGRPDTRAGLSLIDDRACIAGLQALGIDIARFWDAAAYAARRDADLETWRARARPFGAHPDDRDAVARQLRALALRA